MVEDKEVRGVALGLIRLMNGLPLLEAVMALHLAEEMLREACRVDITTADFDYMVKQWEVRYADPTARNGKDNGGHRATTDAGCNG